MRGLRSTTVINKSMIWFSDAHHNQNTRLIWDEFPGQPVGRRKNRQRNLAPPWNFVNCIISVNTVPKCMMEVNMGDSEWYCYYRVNRSYLTEVSPTSTSFYVVYIVKQHLKWIYLAIAQTLTKRKQKAKRHKAKWEINNWERTSLFSISPSRAGWWSPRPSS